MVVVAFLVVILVPAQLPLDRPVRGRPRHQAGRQASSKDDQLVALNGEAGYQADLLMPGPAVQALADLQGRALPVGAGAAGPHRPGHRPGRRGAADRAPSPRSTSPSSAASPTSATFLANGGQRGVQRPVLPPGTTAPIHPVGFVVITSDAGLRQGDLRRRRCAAVDQVDPAALQGHPHHAPGRPRHRRRGHHARGPAVGRHRQPHRRLHRRDRHGAVGHRLAGPDHPGRAARPRTTCTTTTRTTRRSSTTAAASASSTTRCSTARTCSTRSW